MMQDLRYAVRLLRRQPAFAAVAVLILAIGIAANTTVFAVVNTILLRPLPFPDSDRLVWFTSGRDSIAQGRLVGGLSGVTYTVDAFEEFQRHNGSFQSVTAYDPFLGDAEFTMLGAGEPQPVAAVRVARNFFQTLGVQPALGRLFTAEECRKGGPAAVLLSHAFWLRHFDGDPRVIGSAVKLRGTPTTIVGVLPESFDFGSVFAPGVKLDVYVPAVMDVLRTWGNTLAIVGRLKADVTVERARHEADVLFPRFKAAHPEWWGDYTSSLSSLKDFVTGHLRRALVVLWSAVAMIMLIACVNLSNLLLARSAGRSKEFAMRTALGATRRRIMSQLLVESLLLSFAGAMLGTALAYGLTAYLSRQGSIALPLLSSIRVDGAALLWTVLVAVAAAVIFGTAPGLRMASGNVNESLKDAGHGLTAGRKHERLRSTLVVSEVALACVLLIGSGLLLRSFLRVLDVDLGFQPDRAAVIRVDYDDGGSAERRAAILEQTIARVGAIPGVNAVGFTDMLPLGRNRSWGLAAKGRTYTRDDERITLIRVVTPGYIEAMGMHLVSGRDFTWQDGTKDRLAVIVNEAAARRHWGDVDPVGRIAMLTPTVEARVVGVVANIRQQTVESDVSPEMFQPVTQADPEGGQLVIRTTRALETLTPDVMRTLRALNPAQPSAALEPLQQIVDRAVSSRWFFVALVAAFAAIGLVLASLGIYGVISYTVARRTQEIGIRMALGASAHQVQVGIVAGSMRLVLIGIALGTAASLAVGRSLAALLFETEPTDAATFACIALLLAAVSLLAGYVPARRTSRINPIITLRST
jgi:predicted permease